MGTLFPPRCTRLWSLDGTLLQTLQGHKDAVLGVSFSPDGRDLASANFDGTVIVRNLDLDNLMARGCNWVHDYLRINPNVSESDRSVCNGIGSRTYTKSWLTNPFIRQPNRQGSR
jgi:WD40 repeat protein